MKAEHNLRRFAALTERTTFSGEDLFAGFGAADPNDPSSENWHHEGITRRGARLAGWPDSNAADPEAPTANLAWHADYVDSYLYNYLFWFMPDQGGLHVLDRWKVAVRIRPELTKVHFDDLTSTSQIRIMWHRYIGGVRSAVYWAAQTNNVLAARNAVGVCLHALQDFYSHSNWVDDASRRTTTWSEASTSGPADLRASMHLYTGMYEVQGHHGHKHHGKMSLPATLFELVPDGVLDLVCSIPFVSGTQLCEAYRDSKDGVTSPSSFDAAGFEVPDGLIVYDPAGIALDSRWLSPMARSLRDLAPEDTVDGPQLFAVARELAIRHSASFLSELETFANSCGLGGFWDKVKNERASELRFGGFEDPSLVAFQFLSAGNYPPQPQARDEGWFLRLEVETSRVDNAGTDADVYAVVDGKSFLLDYEGSLVIGFNDFESGDRTCYTLGPFPESPRTVTLKTKVPDLGDALKALWDSFVDSIEAFVSDLGDVLLSLVGGHADRIGDAHLAWSWQDLCLIADRPGGSSPMSQVFNGGAEGVYRLVGELTVVPETSGLRVRLRLHSLDCLAESGWDRGSDSDEPFFVTMVEASGSGEMISRLFGPFEDVDGKESVGLDSVFDIFVPRWSGLTLGGQLWESDDESGNARRKIHSEFVARYEDSELPERKSFIEAVGGMIGADWHLHSVDAWAFLRDTSVQMVHALDRVVVDRWVTEESPIELKCSTVVALDSRLPESYGTFPGYLRILEPQPAEEPLLAFQTSEEGWPFATIAPSLEYVGSPSLGRVAWLHSSDYDFATHEHREGLTLRLRAPSDGSVAVHKIAAFFEGANAEAHIVELSVKEAPLWIKDVINQSPFEINPFDSPHG